MNKSRGSCSEFDIAMATKLGNRRLLAAHDAIDDVSHDRRLEEQLCRLCFYLQRERIAMQAFCTKPCASCGEDQRYANSNTDLLCHACAVERGLCKKCGARMNEKVQPEG